MFKQVSIMNEAFGNPKGNPQEIDFARLEKQCSNILDEYKKLQEALAAKDPVLVRDALCDITASSLLTFVVLDELANIIGNAVPVKLGEYVATVSMSISDRLKTDS
jgi:hypothetical protein